MPVKIGIAVGGNFTDFFVGRSDSSLLTET